MRVRNASRGVFQVKVLFLKIRRQKLLRFYKDHVPSIDYSFEAIFSTYGRGLDHMSSRKQDEIERIFRRLSTIHVQPFLVGLGNEQCHDGFANWYGHDVALMQSCRAGRSYDHDAITIKLANILLTLSSMFSETSRVIQILPNSARVTANNYSISNFLTMPYFDNIARETGGRFSEGSMSIALIDSVMAFGYQAYLTLSQRFITPEERKKADCYSIIALRSRGSVLCSPNTLLKLQVSRVPLHYQVLSTNFLDTFGNGPSKSYDALQSNNSDFVLDNCF